MLLIKLPSDSCGRRNCILSSFHHVTLFLAEHSVQSLVSHLNQAGSLGLEEVCYTSPVVLRHGPLWTKQVTK